jgi:2'-5' RNA ligase
MPRTALIVAVPEAEPAVGALRLAHDWSAPLGVPAHVTILFPFADGADVDEQAVAELAASFPSFAFELDRVERFESGLTWLHPEPSAPFAALTDAVWRRFPDYPPYEGAHGVVIPHLTVSEEPIEVAITLPIRATASAVTLIEETADGRWSVRRVFAFLAMGA